MLFYVIFSVGLLWPRRTGIIAIVFSIVALCMAANLLVPADQASSAIAVFVSHPILIEFAAGVVIGYVYCSGVRFNRAVGFMIFATGFILLLVVPGFNSVIDHWRFIHYGIPASLMLSAAVFSKGMDQVAVSRSLLEVGETSYAIYLSHPFVTGAIALVFSRAGFAESLSPLNLLFTFSTAVVVVSLAVGYLVHYAFDLPFTNWLRHKWSPRLVRGSVLRAL